ncbi:TetR/AcrR family transcriptional regulator C-terminal domain-containing protein [Nocardia iowensis]|uniref:TetR/AcrR family transcriptional regulator C-terminal domain-containing protein n=1 Tax=Nocardia iowensis TaxID=204891 RepID=A0ABX8RPR7_NOCIO|nr:TetR/AcrR family transcriptional regulator C-terminal domain-containing protein [Nocardia iowensis]QXN91588.1 TetR/AcrR family transcriptional regulator C-terminal domain-containing protein [Nocardia iowensis]
MAVEKQQIGSVWTRPRRGREQPALTREQIVAEAVGLLDSEGMEALTMRQLGARLNAGATSLYRHVANRDELIELVVDEVYGEIRVPEIADPADWRTATETCAESMRAMILRHPWMASTLGQVGLSYLGPNVMRLNDGLVGLFEAGGFPAAEAGDAISAVMSYVVGMGISEAAWLALLARTGQTEQELIDQLRPAAEEAAKDYPRFQQDDWDMNPTERRDRKFRYGLDRVLDGLNARRG